MGFHFSSCSSIPSSTFGSGGGGGGVNVFSFPSGGALNMGTAAFAPTCGGVLVAGASFGLIFPPFDHLLFSSDCLLASCHLVFVPIHFLMVAFANSFVVVDFVDLATSLVLSLVLQEFF